MSNFDKYLHLLLHYFSVLFSESYLHNAYDIISDNFRFKDKFKHQGAM